MWTGDAGVKESGASMRYYDISERLYSADPAL